MKKNKDTLSLKEHTHQFWKVSTYGAGILCVLLFILFWNISAVLWSGIFRLGSFIFFAFAVLGYLKIMNGPLIVHLGSTQDHLLVSYEKNGEIIQEEQFDRSTVKKITPTRENYDLLSSYLEPHSAALKVQFTDTSNEVYLFEFSGRPLYFDQGSLHDVQEFLISRNIINDSAEA